MTEHGGADVLDGLGPAARRAMAAAEDEARALGTTRVGTEHLLLGVLASSTGGAADILRSKGVTLAQARRKVAETNIGSTDGPAGPTGPAWRSARADRALNRAFRFAHDQRSPVVRTEHLLLGVLDVEGTAGQVLRGLGTDVDGARAALAAIDPAVAEEEPVEPAPAKPRPAATPVCPSCGAGLDAGLAATVVPAGDREAVVFSCGACGTTLGAAPA